MTEPTPSKNRDTGGSHWAIWIVVALAVYVISPMPLAKAHQMITGKNELSPTTEKFFETVYLPLEWLYEHSKIVEAFYAWQRELLHLNP